MFESATARVGALRRRDALRHGVLAGLWIAGPILAVLQFWALARFHALGVDAHAYWLTAHHTDLYGAPPDTRDAYLYSPAFAQLIHPLAMLPFPVFGALVIGLDAACFAWLLAPLGWQWAVPLWLVLATEYSIGNVVGLLTVVAVVAVAGRAGWWAVGWLTKITPGLLGLTWHVSRRQWRNAGACLAWSAGIAGLSYLVSPDAWHAWVTFLTSAPGTSWVALRLVLALTLVAVGARFGWLWVLPIALVLATPVMGGVQALAYLAGLVRLWGRIKTTETVSPEAQPARERRAIVAPTA